MRPDPWSQQSHGLPCHMCPFYLATQLEPRLYLHQRVQSWVPAALHIGLWEHEVPDGKVSWPVLGFEVPYRGSQSTDYQHRDRAACGLQHRQGWHCHKCQHGERWDPSLGSSRCHPFKVRHEENQPQFHIMSISFVVGYSLYHAQLAEHVAGLVFMVWLTHISHFKCYICQGPVYLS